MTSKSRSQLLLTNLIMADLTKRKQRLTFLIIQREYNGSKKDYIINNLQQSIPIAKNIETRRIGWGRMDYKRLSMCTRHNTVCLLWEC